MDVGPANCPKMKLNGKKLGKFHFHIPGLLKVSKYRKQFIVSNVKLSDYFSFLLALGKFLGAMECGIGTFQFFATHSEM